MLVVVRSSDDGCKVVMGSHLCCCKSCWKGSRSLPEAVGRGSVLQMEGLCSKGLFCDTTQWSRNRCRSHVTSCRHVSKRRFVGRNVFAMAIQTKSVCQHRRWKCSSTHEIARLSLKLLAGGPTQLVSCAPAFCYAEKFSRSCNFLG